MTELRFYPNKENEYIPLNEFTYKDLIQLLNIHDMMFWPCYEFQIQLFPVLN